MPASPSSNDVSLVTTMDPSPLLSRTSLINSLIELSASVRVVINSIKYSIRLTGCRGEIFAGQLSHRDTPNGAAANQAAEFVEKFRYYVLKPRTAGIQVLRMKPDVKDSALLLHQLETLPQTTKMTAVRNESSPSSKV